MSKNLNFYHKSLQLRSFTNNLMYNKIVKQNLFRFVDKCSYYIKHSSNQTFPCVSSKINMSVFKISDYDCIGFDLDNTLLKYNITNLVHLEYKILANYLVKEKGYNRKYLLKPLNDKDLDFMQKGLFLDFDRGNILRISPDGKIQRACHGSKLMSIEKIKEVYPEQRWHVMDTFSNDMLATWNEPLNMKMRSLLDYFDIPSALIFARTVDTLDEENNKPLDIYNIWPDMLSGLIWMFDPKHFELDEGQFFPALKKNPDKYLHKCSPETISWIQEMKKDKITFLITGSNIDFVDLTATYALGENWRSFFDIVICYAKKPGFFIQGQPFMTIMNNKEVDVISSNELLRGNVYSRGNWKELLEFFSRISCKQNPRCIYIGDNLIQDIYVPKTYGNCDTIALVEEQMSEGMIHQCLSHPDDKILNSTIWGSYFCLKDTALNVDSIWGYIIKSCSEICIPSLDLITKNDAPESFTPFNKDKKDYSGYYPAVPLSISDF